MDEHGVIAQIERGITAIREQCPKAAEQIRVELGDVQFAALEHRRDVQQGYLELLEPFGNFAVRMGPTESPTIQHTRLSRFPVARVGVPDHLKVAGATPFE